MAADKVGTRAGTDCCRLLLWSRGPCYLRSGVLDLGTSLAMFSGACFGNDLGRLASTGPLAVSMVSGRGFSGDACFFFLGPSGFGSPAFCFCSFGLLASADFVLRTDLGMMYREPGCSTLVSA